MLARPQNTTVTIGGGEFPFKTNIADESITVAFKTKYGSATLLDNVEFSGYEQRPAVVVDRTWWLDKNRSRKDSLTEGVDYSVAYRNNVNAGTAKVVITGKGSYSGSREITFKISPKDISTLPRNNPPDVKYNAGLPVQPLFFPWKANNMKNYPEYGTDYMTSYSNNSMVGIATETMIGKGNYSGTVSFTFNVVPAPISDWYGSYSIPDQKYTGLAIKPVKALGSSEAGGGSYFDSNGVLHVVLANTHYLKEGVDYVVTYENNVKVGTATATITGKGNCSGSVTKTFNIVSNGNAVEEKGSSSGTTTVTAPTQLVSSQPANSSGASQTQTATVQQGKNMYRLYNPNSGEHFYTASATEKDGLVKAGWVYEGDRAWIAPEKSNTPVFRLYNPNAGDHHYTTSLEERNWLVEVGWNAEGIGWYSDDNKATPVYRLYNPNAKGAGAHHYTTSEKERNQLVSAGWKYEGIGWYGM